MSLIETSSTVVPAGVTAIAARASMVLNDRARRLPEIATMLGIRRV
jgi:hypothetical protein